MVKRPSCSKDWNWWREVFVTTKVRNLFPRRTTRTQHFSIRLVAGRCRTAHVGEAVKLEVMVDTQFQIRALSVRCTFEMWADERTVERVVEKRTLKEDLAFVVACSRAWQQMTAMPNVLPGDNVAKVAGAVWLTTGGHGPLPKREHLEGGTSTNCL